MSDPRLSPTASSAAAGYAGDLGPRETWEGLTNDPHAQLIDVRTEAEWNFVGVPDLGPLNRQALLCEWQRFPPAGNPNFSGEVAEALNQTNYRKGSALFFLCRSGARSRAAAIAMTQMGYGPCFNVADGFEGSLDQARHRGSAAGWKASGLPWIQS
jgi:rhodanese-related sulfurtransferase